MKIDLALTGTILAVDAGVRTGMALFDTKGTLIWYGSHNYGKRQSLKKAVSDVLKKHQVRWLILEGGGDIVDIWEGQAKKMGIAFLHLHAMEWRSAVLHGKDWETNFAKEQAIKWARKIIGYCGGRQQKTIRHDAAEAIICGFYMLIKEGIIQPPPGNIFPRYTQV